MTAQPLTLTLPLPPSVNACWANRKHGKGRGRVKTAAYRSWINAAGLLLNVQKPGSVSGPYNAIIVLPRMQGDPDNRVKPILDLLVTMGVTADDRNCQRIHVSRDPSASDVTVILEAA